MTVTRIFRRPPMRARRPSNGATQIHQGPAAILPVGKPMAVEADFEARYPAIRAGLEASPEQGLLLMLFDPKGHVVAQGWLRSTLDKTRAAIVGRHSQCDLRAPDVCENISLRHLAILVRAVDHQTTRVRVLDLASGLGFADEAGRALQAVTAEGSLFLRVGELELWLITTDPDAPPPEDARAAYQCIPSRVFVEERVGGPAERSPVRPIDHLGLGPGATQVRSMAGPLVDARRLCTDDEVPEGQLEVRGDYDVLTRAVGPGALDRGLLVGRYDRCDLVRSADNALSRVHLLIVRDGPDVLAIDTASSNGTELDGALMTQAPLREGTTLELPDDLRLTWRPEAP